MHCVCPFLLAGKYTWSDGAFYDGTWVYGKRTGRGVSWLVYMHELSGCPLCVGLTLRMLADVLLCGGNFSASGTIVEPDGTRYDGDWKDDVFHGSGKQVFPDGSFYEGSWRENKQCGHGVHHYSDGEVYEGDWMVITLCRLVALLVHPFSALWDHGALVPKRVPGRRMASLYTIDMHIVCSLPPFPSCRIIFGMGRGNAPSRMVPRTMGTG